MGDDYLKRLGGQHERCEAAGESRKNSRCGKDPHISANEGSATIAVLFDDHLAPGMYSDDNEPRNGEQGTCGGRHVALALFA